MSQLHKRFRDDQIKELFTRYLNKEIEMSRRNGNRSSTIVMLKSPMLYHLKPKEKSNVLMAGYKTELSELVSGKT